MTARSTTRVTEPDTASITDAARILAGGGLVAFPTETVYGLGADATNGTAVARLYEAKGRPAFNPLIAHVPDVKAAQVLVTFDQAAAALAAAFWPGPLTSGPSQSRRVSGRRTCLRRPRYACVRMPDHPVAHAILEAFGKPIVAPSANRSGHVSPTTASHVLADLAGRIDLIVDGGPTPVGVESTVVACLGEPMLLRPGGLPRDAIERCSKTNCTPPRRGCGQRSGAAIAWHAGDPLRAAHAAAPQCRERRARRSTACVWSGIAGRRGAREDRAEPVPAR